MRAGHALLGLAVICAPGAAHAGRTFYGWLYGTEVMPERSAELNTWISEENHHDTDAYETSWLLQPTIGITDQLELNLPVDILWARDGAKAFNALDSYGIDLRYRLVSQDPVDAPAIAPLVRVAIKRSVVQRDMVQPEADFVVSYSAGRLHALVDLGAIGQITPNDHHFEIRPGGGVSIEAIDDLRFGAEVYSEITLDTGTSWAIVGPNLAWSHGRSWISAAYGIGITGISNAPRIQWGIAF